MNTFVEANKAKLSLKMMLSNYSWFNSISVETDGDGYCVVVHSSRMDNGVRKVVPIVHNGISVRVEVDSNLKKER